MCDAGWPSLHWFVTENLSKPPRDWLPPARPADNAPAYVEVGSMSFSVLHGCPYGNDKLGQLHRVCVGDTVDWCIAGLQEHKTEPSGTR